MGTLFYSTSAGGIWFALVFRYVPVPAGKAFWIMGAVCMAANVRLFLSQSTLDFDGLVLASRSPLLGFQYPSGEPVTDLNFTTSFAPRHLTSIPHDVFPVERH